MLAARGAQFLLLTVAATAGLYARSAVAPLQETIRIALALSDNQMALLQGPALALAPVIAAIPIGVIVDRWSRVRLLFICAVSNIVGTVITALAPNFAVLFLFRGVIGLAHTAISIAAFSLVADLYAPAQRGRATMVVIVAQYAGIAAAFALGGALVSMSGTGPSGWRWAMFCSAGPLVPVMFLILAMHEPPRTGVVIINPSPREAFTEIWRYRTVIAPLLLGLVMTEIADCAALVWAAPTLSRNFGLSPNRIGAVMSMVMLVSGIVGSIGGGILADLCQRAGGGRRTMSVLSGLALLSVPASLFAIVARVDVASVMLVGLFMILSAIIVMAVTLLTMVVPSELRGLCVAVSSGANTFFGVALAPMMVSMLSGVLGGAPTIGKALTVICAASGFFGTAMFALGRRYFPRPVLQ